MTTKPTFSAACAASTPTLIGELREFKTKPVLYGFRLTAGEVQEQRLGQEKFYSIARVSL
jgi:hypothetical protein